MSNFSTVDDFLSHTQKLHARITQFYGALSVDASNERVKMLLDILTRHELELLSFIDDYIEKSPAKVRDTFIQFDREEDIDYLFKTDFERNQINAEDVEVIAHRFDQYFSDLYKGISETDEYDKVQDVFENLRQHMEEQKKRLSIDVNELQDI